MSRVRRWRKKVAFNRVCLSFLHGYTAYIMRTSPPWLSIMQITGGHIILYYIIMLLEHTTVNSVEKHYRGVLIDIILSWCSRATFTVGTWTEWNWLIVRKCARVRTPIPYRYGTRINNTHVALAINVGYNIIHSRYECVNWPKYWSFFRLRIVLYIKYME